MQRNNSAVLQHLIASSQAWFIVLIITQLDAFFQLGTKKKKNHHCTGKDYGSFV